ncbi:transposase family protein [Thermosynechococcaceae cyanobacterium BACA0444]|uniref:Transposase family protein n=1 Tax=Pseudocalidococcus azoricus BACA0444 TaxID=2918990 RepID=A0AAE4FT05_9CYAN|nr:transposase family protein [Pseudocalidococcus azoricus]MDS3861665.1 transposase family protein [Pseudocalidococcus azoricus BACA0444]
MTALIRPSSNVTIYFQALGDSRAANLLEHKLLDMIGLALCAVICGANSWVEIEADEKTVRHADNWGGKKGAILTSQKNQMVRALAKPAVGVGSTKGDVPPDY